MLQSDELHQARNSPFYTLIAIYWRLIINLEEARLRRGKTVRRAVHGKNLEPLRKVRWISRQPVGRRSIKGQKKQDIVIVWTEPKNKKLMNERFAFDEHQSLDI